MTTSLTPLSIKDMAAARPEGPAPTMRTVVEDGSDVDMSSQDCCGRKQKRTPRFVVRSSLYVAVEGDDRPPPPCIVHLNVMRAVVHSVCHRISIEKVAVMRDSTSHKHADDDQMMVCQSREFGRSGGVVRMLYSIQVADNLLETLRPL